MLRTATFAGSFYDSDPNQLRKDFDKWFKDARVSDFKENLIGLICPHAGYMYSGFCAAHSYKLLSKYPIKNVIIIHPSHRGNHFDFSVSPFTEYQTPLGNLTRNNVIANKIIASGAEVIDNFYHQNEHSMEVQLPFIAYTNQEIQIIPVLLGMQNIEVSQKLAGILSDLVDENTIIIVSSDLSHYHSATDAEILDRRLIVNTQSLDTVSFYENIRSGKTEACGFAGILTLMFLAKMKNNAKFNELLYTHSGITSEDYNQVVGYFSAALLEE